MSKIYKEQLCYYVDLNEYKNQIDLNGELSLSLYIDYNGDREFKKIVGSDDKEKPSVMVNTIGL